MIPLSLQRRHSALADPAIQLQLLQQLNWHPSFSSRLAECRSGPLQSDGVRVLQVNVGRLCNQTCAHCHVDAGPDRREVMSRETMQLCLDSLSRSDIPTLDITGGAPEMNPHFRWLVTEARKLGRHVIDRCNLTILLAPGYTDLPEFLAENSVEIVASLPCYLEENVDRQRGDGVFTRSIVALRQLNELGYGRPGGELALNLVYNPVGPSLPPDQVQLEGAYRLQLAERYGISFTRLYTITNMPISRFLDDLLQSGRCEAYMEKLVNAFNPAAIENLMCRTMISVDWQGNLYDCDFNQMLEMPVHPSVPRHIRDFDPEAFAHRPIVTAPHCYGCTAGAGSSCQGAIVGEASV